MNVPHKRATVLAQSTRRNGIRLGSTLLTLSLITVPSWATEQPSAPHGEQATKAPQASGLIRPVIAHPPATQDVTESSLKRGVTLQTEAGAKATARFTSKLPIGPGGKMFYVENVLVESGRVDAFVPEAQAAGVLLQSADNVQAIAAAGHVGMVIGPHHVSVAAFDSPILAGKSGVFKPQALLGLSRIVDFSSTIRAPSSTGAADTPIPVN